MGLRKKRANAGGRGTLNHMSEGNEEQGGTPSPSPPPPEEGETLVAGVSSFPSRPVSPTLPLAECTSSPSLQVLLTGTMPPPPPPPPSIAASQETFEASPSETASLENFEVPLSNVSSLVNFEASPFDETTVLIGEDLLPQHVLDAVVTIESKEQFDEALIEAGNKLVVIDFTASWCGPCQMIAPYFELLSERHRERVSFLRVDVDDQPDIADEYEIAAMPTFVFIKNGEKVDEFCGDCPDTLAAKIILLK